MYCFVIHSNYTVNRKTIYKNISWSLFFILICFDFVLTLIIDFDYWFFLWLLILTLIIDCDYDCWLWLWLLLVTMIIDCEYDYFFDCDYWFWLWLLIWRWLSILTVIIDFDSYRCYPVFDLYAEWSLWIIVEAWWSFLKFALSGVSVADVYPDCQNHCRLMADGEAGQTGLYVQDPVGEVCRRPRGNVINQGNQEF